MIRINRFQYNWLAFSINNLSFLINFKSISELHTCNNGLVIDLGCGDAPFKNEINLKGLKYVGVDWPFTLHDKSEIDVFADLTKPFPFKDSVADIIVCFQVLEHIPEPEFFLRECNRILKAGGSIFITVPFMWHVHEEPYDFYRFTRYGLEYLLKKVGFQDIKVKENTGFWQTWILKFNYQSARWARGPLKYLFVPLWFALQTIAPILDNFDFNPRECASYTVLARKP